MHNAPKGKIEPVNKFKVDGWVIEEESAVSDWHNFIIARPLDPYEPTIKKRVRKRGVRAVPKCKSLFRLAFDGKRFAVTVERSKFEQMHPARYREVCAEIQRRYGK